MLVTASQDIRADTSRLMLRRFAPPDAGHVPLWVSDGRELRWLAPGTPPPLTAEKVLDWERPGCATFVLARQDAPDPIAYGELHPMRRCAGGFWLGHIIVSPAHRGQGLGRLFVRELLHEAFDRRSARQVVLIVFPDNVAAIACYRGLGFQITREERHRFPGFKTQCRLLRLELTRQAYERARGDHSRVDCREPGEAVSGVRRIPSAGVPAERNPFR